VIGIGITSNRCSACKRTDCKDRHSLRKIQDRRAWRSPLCTDDKLAPCFGLRPLLLPDLGLLGSQTFLNHITGRFPLWPRPPSSTNI